MSANTMSASFGVSCQGLALKAPVRARWAQPKVKDAKVQRAGNTIAHAAQVSAPANSAPPATVETVKKVELQAEASYLTRRVAMVRDHFDSALSGDDFIARSEMALCAFGFNSENTIAVTNLCRDESTACLKDKIDAAYGDSFNINGLGGLLTCGVIGMKAGLSHSPIGDSGKERYVFFSFPHVAVDANGQLGNINRACRPGPSGACGALIATLGMMKKDGLEPFLKKAGEHDPLEPEFSILTQRLARRIRAEGLNPQDMDLADITKVAERTITNDLKYLVERAVDTSKADYAVITGIQIHNWAEHNDVPNLDLVQPCTSYVVVDGQRFNLDLNRVPSLTPRQLKMIATNGVGAEELAGGWVHNASFVEEPKAPKAKNLKRSQTYLSGLQAAPLVVSQDLQAAAQVVGAEPTTDAADEVLMEP